MNQVSYLIIAIAIVAILAVIFVFSYIMNHRMPAPEGASEHKPSAERCGPCSELGCPFYERFHKEGE